MEQDMLLAQQVDKWISRSTLSAAQVAARAGVSGSTIHRLRRGVGDPSIGTLRDVAAACGFSIDVVSRPLSDPLAAAAARAILEDDFSWLAGTLSGWDERLRRSASAPLEILRVAARASNPLARPGATHFSGKATVGMLASAGTSTGAVWAISGAAGLTLPARQQPLDGHTLLWAADADAAAAQVSASMRKVPHPAAARVTVLAADAWLFENSFVHESIHYAAPIQLMMDCLAIGGAEAQQAEQIVSEW